MRENKEERKRVEQRGKKRTMKTRIENGVRAVASLEGSE